MLEEDAGVRRIIFLGDMNAFFISCETIRRPELANVPAAVAGDPAHRSGIILAANYPARACGVRTAMVLHEARKRCPSLQTLPPDHTFYTQKSEEVMTLLSRFTPLVEPNSIDEAWLDMTGCESLFKTPLEAAGRIMGEIRDELGLPCSIGIAGNKVLAKMASEMKKPMGITTLWTEEVGTKLWRLPVGAMHGVGNKTAVRMERLGIRTIGDLARYDTRILEKAFGKSGQILRRHANGLDDEPVLVPEADAMKSIGKSTTLDRDEVTQEAIKPVLMHLVEDVAASARRHDKLGTVVRLTLKYGDFSTVARQMKVDPTHATDDMLRAVFVLLEKHWIPGRPVRLVGVSLEGFLAHEGQLSLFDASPDMGSSTRIEAEPARSKALDATVDLLREKFGEGIVRRASLMQHEKPLRHGGPGGSKDHPEADKSPPKRYTD